MGAMPFAYSRDPSFLFQDTDIAQPLNYQSKLFNGIQPVRYTHKRLNQDICDFKRKDEMIEVVDVDWVKGKLIAYYNMEEALNGIIALTIEKFRIKCPPETPMAYIQETVGFLRRGHSLLHPMCSCKHNLTSKRCKTLGISSLYSKRRDEIPCALPRRPREFSASELSDELGIEDIVLFHVEFQDNKKRYSLLQLINQYCNVRIEGLNLHFSHREFHMGPIRNKTDLQTLLCSNPLTVSLKKDQYPGVLSDVRCMVDSGVICYLGESDDEMIIFYFNPRWDIKTVDSDIIDIWHSINPRDLMIQQSSYHHLSDVESWVPDVRKKRRRCTEVKRRNVPKHKLVNYSKIKTR